MIMNTILPQVLVFIFLMISMNLWIISSKKSDEALYDAKMVEEIDILSF